MQVTKIGHAKSYDAPKHFGMRGFRVQGGDITPFLAQVGVSIFEPSGGAELSASKADRVYLVHSGAISVMADGVAHELGPLDSCFIPAGQERSIMNSGVIPAILITLIQDNIQ